MRDGQLGNKYYSVLWSHAPTITRIIIASKAVWMFNYVGISFFACISGSSPANWSCHVRLLSPSPYIWSLFVHIYMAQYATFQYFCIWIYLNWFYSGFSTELSFHMFVKNILESQMPRKSETLQIMSKCLNKYLKIKHKNPFINDLVDFRPKRVNVDVDFVTF